MSRLLIANDCPEQVLGYNAEFNKGLAVWALRLLWHINDDESIVLPIEPDVGYVEYITQLTGVRYESLKIIVAPRGNADNLSSDRIMNIELCNAINDALSGRCLKIVLPLTPDNAVVRLARALGAESCVPGSEFASQGGGVLANSKAAFRAIAAGAGVPIPTGSVTNDPSEAEEIIADMLLSQSVPIIVKKDFGQGCRGNEVLSSVEGVVPNGGRRGLILANRVEIKNYISENWSWLTNAGHHNVIIERYYPGSRAIFAEFNINDKGVQFAGLGEMLAAPIADGQVIPPVGLSPTTVAEIIEGGHQLSAAMHAIGYRGTLSADAIITTEGIVLFSEYNGRITGSTHIYSTIGACVVGKEWMKKRILLERRGWKVPSFQMAVDMLNNAGLAFNRETRSGVILTGTFVPTRKVISYTVVAEDLTAAKNFEEKLHRVSPRAIEVLN